MDLCGIYAATTILSPVGLASVHLGLTSWTFFMLFWAQFVRKMLSYPVHVWILATDQHPLLCDPRWLNRGLDFLLLLKNE